VEDKSLVKTRKGVETVERVLEERVLETTSARMVRVSNNEVSTAVKKVVDDALRNRGL